MDPNCEWLPADPLSDSNTDTDTVLSLTTSYRFTRSQDRQHNLVNYPHLTYPELYILEGGYKAFFETFRDLCQPDQYLPMEANQAGLRQYHGQSAVKSKGWDKNGGGQRGYKRATLAARNFNSDS